VTPGAKWVHFVNSPAAPGQQTQIKKKPRSDRRTAGVSTGHVGPQAFTSCPVPVLRPQPRRCWGDGIAVNLKDRPPESAVGGVGSLRDGRGSPPIGAHGERPRFHRAAAAASAARRARGAARPARLGPNPARGRRASRGAHGTRALPLRGSCSPVCPPFLPLPALLAPFIALWPSGSGRALLPPSPLSFTHFGRP
jgi:hypothetical protein